MEGRSGRLKVLNLQMSDMARQVENAIQFGQSVLLQDVMQEIDPILEPVLAKSFIKRGNQTLIKLGDKEVRACRPGRSNGRAQWVWVMSGPSWLAESPSGAVPRGLLVRPCDRS
jgi:hypothetical protein